MSVMDGASRGILSCCLAAIWWRASCCLTSTRWPSPPQICDSPHEPVAGRHRDNRSRAGGDGHSCWPSRCCLICSGLAVRQYTRFADASDKVEHTHEVLDLHRPRRHPPRRRGGRPSRLPAHQRPRVSAALRGSAGADTRTPEPPRELVADNPEQQALSRRLGTVADGQDSSRWLTCSSCTMAATRRRDRTRSRKVWAARHGRDPRRRRRDARRGRLAARPAGRPGAPGATRGARVRDRQPGRGDRARVRGGVGRPQLRAPSRRVRGADARPAGGRTRGPRRRRGPAAERELQSQHPRQLGRLHPGPRTRRPDGAGESSRPRPHGNRRRGRARGPAVDVALERRRRPRAAGHRRRDGRGEGRFHAFRPTAKGTPKWWDVIVTPIRDERGHVQKLRDRLARHHRAEACRAGTRAAPGQRALGARPRPSARPG